MVLVLAAGRGDFQVVEEVRILLELVIYGGELLQVFLDHFVLISERGRADERRIIFELVESSRMLLDEDLEALQFLLHIGAGGGVWAGLRDERAGKAEAESEDRGVDRGTCRHLAGNRTTELSSIRYTVL